MMTFAIEASPPQAGEVPPPLEISPTIDKLRRNQAADQRRGDLDNLERHGRVELAAALRIACRLGLHEGVCDHFSLTMTDDGSEFLVNPQGLHWSELRASDLVRVRGDGTIVAGAGPVEASAFHIHGGMHAARPEARCISDPRDPHAAPKAALTGGVWTPLRVQADLNLGNEHVVGC
jgi:hypothetical protein